MKQGQKLSGRQPMERVRRAHSRRDSPRPLGLAATAEVDWSKRRRACERVFDCARLSLRPIDGQASRMSSGHGAEIRELLEHFNRLSLGVPYSANRALFLASQMREYSIGPVSKEQYLRGSGSSLTRRDGKPLGTDESGNLGAATASRTCSDGRRSQTTVCESVRRSHALGSEHATPENGASPAVFRGAVLGDRHARHRRAALSCQERPVRRFVEQASLPY